MEMETYKVSIHSGVREMETRLLQKREPAGDEVLLKVTSCAICTLEQRIWKGVIARYPYAGGHEAAGIVEAVGPDVKGVKPGDKAAVLRGAYAFRHYGSGRLCRVYDRQRQGGV